MKQLLGAAIKIPNQKEPYTTTERKCSCKTHYHDEKFCSYCGENIKAVEVQKESVLWCEDLIGNENFVNYFIGEDTYFFSNFGHGRIEVNEDKPVLKINLELIQICITTFIEKHRTDIKLLEDKIGESVTVEFFLLEKQY